LTVLIKPDAQNTINEIAEFIDGINTPGAGDRWTDRILDFIAAYAQPGAQYALCNNPELANELFSCVTFNNWVIVFKIEKNTLVVYHVIHGSVVK